MKANAMDIADGADGPSHTRHPTTRPNLANQPVPNATTPYWRTRPHPIDEHRSTEDLPQECDVAIIGAGMSGVATAYHLCQESKPGKPPSIVILEARQVCSGATGRNGGHAKIRTTTLMNLARQQGREAAEQVAAFISEQITTLKHVVETEGLDCEFELRRSFDVFLDADEATEVERRFRQSLKAGQLWTRERSFVDGRIAEQVTSLTGAKAALSVPACSFWPYKLVSQLLARLVENALVNLQTNTPVTHITQDATGHSILHTPRGVLKANKVVFATNAYTSGICPQYAGTIIPYKGTAVHITPSAPILPHLSHTYNISYPPLPGCTDRVDYLNPRPDGGIVVGGGKWTYAQDRSLWYNTCDDSTLLPGPRRHFGGLMQRHFMGWENSGARVDSEWTGIMGLTPDECPHVGVVPGGEGREYVIAGFNGGGMALIFLCARGLARMMVTGVPFGESGVPSMFEATQERLAKECGSTL